MEPRVVVAVENPITESRKRLGLTKRQFCHVTGVRLDALYLIEAGLVNRPQRVLLKSLASLGFDEANTVRLYARGTAPRS